MSAITLPTISKNELNSALQGLEQAAHSPTFAGWRASGIRIGRVSIDHLEVADRQGAVDVHRLIGQLMDKTSRRKTGGTQSRYSEPLPMATAARLFSEEVADYLSDMERRGLDPDTIKKRKHALRLFKLASGDIPVNEITGKHIAAFWEVLRWWPERAGVPLKYRGLTDAEIYQKGRDENRKAPAASHMTAGRTEVSAFFNRLIEMRVISHSPFAGFPPPKDTEAPPAKGRPFTDDELKKIFDPATFEAWASKTPHFFWAPMIGLYTGARITEICQLKLTDIVQVSGVWCYSIQITPDVDLSSNGARASRQKLKGKSSVRTIAIAQPVLDAGFLSYVEDMRARGERQLFPHLKVGLKRKSTEPNGTGYGASFCKQFSLYLQHLEVPKVRFHGFRHTLATEIERAGGTLGVIATITGHSVRKDYPVMQAHYLHARESERLTKQQAALALYKPPVVLPTYVAGQFDASFDTPVKKRRRRSVKRVRADLAHEQ